MRLCLCAAMLLWPAQRAQDSASKTRANDLTFEVAALKINKSMDGESGDFDHGRYYIHGAPLRHLVASAYNMRVGLVVGGAGWMDTDHFNVDAKTDASTTQADARVMLASLLRERFALRVHFESRSKPVFVLTVAKGGPKIRPDVETPADRPGCIGSGPVTCTNRTMAQFADLLPRISAGVDIPVVDETALPGRYTFTLKFAQAPAPGVGEQGSLGPADRQELPSVFEALPVQLGLRLKAAKRPVRFLVIDGARRIPTGD